MMLSFFNNYHIYEVPNRFSYQHVLLLLVDVVYLVGLCILLRKRQFKFQKSVLMGLIITCMLIFVGRMFFGWEWSRIYNDGPKSTLLPLELCNLNIFVMFFVILLNNKNLKNYACFNVMVGGLMPLLVFPDCHMITNGNNLFHYMFFDYWFIHTQLVAIPIAMIACSWFKPEIKKVPTILAITVVIYLFVFIMTLILRQFDPFRTVNYMYSMHHGNLPLLKDLYNIIPIPFVYNLPLIIPMGILFYIISLPFYIIEKRGKKHAV